MALVIINRTKPQAHEIHRLQTNLRNAQESVEYLSEQATNASDDDIEQVFGVPLLKVAGYRVIIANLLAALQDASVDNFIGNLG